MIVTIVIVARSVVTYISIWLQGHFNFHSQMVKMAISKLKGELEGASFFYFFRIIVSFGLVPKIAITLRGSNRVKWGTKLFLSFCHVCFFACFKASLVLL